MDPAPRPTSDAARRAWLPPDAILAAAGLIAPPVAVFDALGVAPLLVVVAALLLAGDWRRCLAGIAPFAPLATLLVLLSLWAAVTALWSPIPAHSALEAGRFLVVSAFGLVVLGSGASLPGGRGWGPGVLAGVAVATILLQVELHWGSPLWRILHGLDAGDDVSLSVYDRGVTLLVLAAWPAAASLVGGPRRWLFPLGIVAIGVTVYAFNSHAAMLAGVVGLGAVLLAWPAPRLVAVLLFGGVLVLAFALPLAAPQGAGIARIEHAVPALRPSAIHRLAIWRFTSDRIAERPLLGWGMDAARAVPGGQTRVIDLMPEVVINADAQVLPLHPHDAALEWRLELGLPGTLLSLAVLGLSLWRIASARALARPHQALALGCSAAVLAVAMLSFGAWQAWWLATIWLVAALLAGISRESRA